jgi:hypothetical protein
MVIAEDTEVCDEPRDAHRHGGVGWAFGKAGAVLTAVGIEKSYRRGMWPLRRRQRVLRVRQAAVQRDAGSG